MTLELVCDNCLSRVEDPLAKTLDDVLVTAVKHFGWAPGNHRSLCSRCAYLSSTAWPRDAIRLSDGSCGAVWPR